jgi:hypothetical protein
VNLFGQFALEEKERRENWQGLGYAWPSLKNLNLNSFEKVLETYQNSFQVFQTSTIGQS